MERQLRLVLAGSLAARLALVAWGHVQDTYFDVNYTDIDYIVFTDAARFVSQGRPPFHRSTFRYSPLLAYLLLPNTHLHNTFGKMLFSLADIVAAYLLAALTRADYGLSDRAALVAASAWLFNPFTATISTRGSCDVLVIVMLLLVLRLLHQRKHVRAALVYGLAVHFRVYPVIYAPSLLLAILQPHARLTLVKCRQAVAFGLSSLSVFAALGGLFYLKYGMTFIHETYTYHLSRLDPRHNFSPYFYPTYLHHFSGGEPGGPPAALKALDASALAGVPQVASLLLLSARFYRQLPVCWTLLTMAFVAFNKVSTAQYFVWYFGLLPLVLVRLPWPVPKGLRYAGACWVVTQLHWLLWAYLLEFQGLPVYLGVWSAGILFLAANVTLMLQIMKHAAGSPLLLGKQKST